MADQADADLQGDEPLELTLDTLHTDTADQQQDELLLDESDMDQRPDAGASSNPAAQRRRMAASGHNLAADATSATAGSLFERMSTVSRPVRAPEPVAEQPAPAPAPAPAPTPTPKPAPTGGLRIPRFLGRQSNQ